jgi:uncharacterized protein (UPF0264 family)
MLKGVVNSTDGETLVGASILKMGTSSGTITDAYGKFELKVNAGDKLKISYIGYKTQVVVIKPNQTVLNVQLATDETTNLNEVVAIGYAQVKKLTMTGSVSAISAK